VILQVELKFVIDQIDQRRRLLASTDVIHSNMCKWTVLVTRSAMSFPFDSSTRL